MTVFSLGFPDRSVGQESTCNAGDPSLIPGSRRSTGEGIGYPLQYSWASFVAQLVKNLPVMQETWIWSLGWKDLLEKEEGTWVGKISWRRKRVPTPVFLGFPCGSAGKESTCNAGDLDSIPRLGWSPGEGKGYPLQYSGLENSMDWIVQVVVITRHHCRFI